jgi:cystathionine beta-lyase
MASKVSVLPPDMHWRTSILGAFAMAEAFTNGEQWLDSALETIQGNFEFMKAEVAAKLPGVTVVEAQNSYLAWWDVTSLNLGTEPAKRIHDDARVAVVPGADLGAGYEQFVRFNYATSRENISEAISRIAAII